MCFSNFSGSNIDPGLIPRTLDYLFDALKSSSALSADPASTTKSIHKFKPDKFNEIVYLTDREYAQEMSAKESILRFASGPSKAGLERVESLDLGSSVRTAAGPTTLPNRGRMTGSGTRCKSCASWTRRCLRATTAMRWWPGPARPGWVRDTR